MTHYIILMKPTDYGPKTDEIWGIFGAHGAYLQAAGEAGTLTFAGLTNGAVPGALSLAVVAAPDLAAAESFARAAPAVEAGLLKAEVEPFSVFIARDLPS